MNVHKCSFAADAAAATTGSRSINNNNENFTLGCVLNYAQIVRIAKLYEMDVA